MMGYGYDGGGVWMWVFGGLMMVGVLLLIGAVVWAIIAATTRGNAAPTAPTDTGGRARTRQLLDERYARGEMTSEEYTERLHTLAL
ncbi:MAG TPA: SHOCT domain-containing protein [Nakamurella sp.]|jgi:putative membrane protein